MAQIKLKTLTPVHIGNGEFYTNFSYLIDRNRIYFIDTQALRLLTPDQAEQLLYLVDTRGHDLNAFVSRYPGLRQKMIAKAKYDLPLHGAATQKVFTFIKSSDRAYIPGTEVKGALRTALLDFLLHQQPFQQRLVQELQKFESEFAQLHTDRKKLTKRVQQLEARLQAIAFRPYADDAKYDLLKLLSVGDSDGKKPSEVLAVAPVQSIGSQRHLVQSHEVVKCGVEFSLELRAVSGKPRDDFLSSFGFESVHQDILRDELTLFKTACQFYDKLLEQEISYFKAGGRQYDKVVEKLLKIKSANTPHNPIIRLGKHQGYLSVTLGLLLKKQAPEFHSKYILPFIKGRTYPHNFPKTRKLVQMDGELYPLGWVQLA